MDVLIPVLEIFGLALAGAATIYVSTREERDKKKRTQSASVDESVPVHYLPDGDVF